MKNNWHYMQQFCDTGKVLHVWQRLNYKNCPVYRVTNSKVQPFPFPVFSFKQLPKFKTKVI